MNSQQEMEERLWDLIDGSCSPGERSALESLIAADPAWELKYQELLAVHQSLAAAEPDAPSLRFTRNTMEEIARHRVAPATNSYINKTIIRGIAAFFLLTLAGVFVYFLSLFKGVDIGGGSEPSGDRSSYSYAFFDHLDKFNWSRIVNNNWLTLFIMINLILGLMLLDRYLHRRREKGGFI